MNPSFLEEVSKQLYHLEKIFRNHLKQFLKQVGGGGDFEKPSD